eukprot:scaffold6589_cov123-Cylindrotheca_fusiformis.AAC.4
MTQDDDSLTTKLTVAMMTRSGKIQRISDKWRKRGPSPIPRIRENVKTPTRNHSSSSSTLEHAVSRTILQTASSGPENAHFVVNQNRMIRTNQTPRSILLDLTQAEYSRGTLTTNRRALKIPTGGATKEKLLPSLQPGLNVADTRRCTREQAPGPALPCFKSHMTKDNNPYRHERRSNGRVSETEAYRSMLSVDLPHSGLALSFDSMSWGDDGSTTSVAITFMTESDAWTSLCTHTYHMGRKKTSIDHDGFPRLASA